MNKQFDGSERRRYIRLLKEIPLKFRILSGEEEILCPWLNAVCKNISLGGIAIEMNNLNEEIKSTLMTKNNILEIEMLLSASADNNLKMQAKVISVSFIGRVKWDHSESDLFEVGVEFVNISPETTEMIRQFLISEYIRKYAE